MPDVQELSMGDLAVAERMASLPNSVLGLPADENDEREKALARDPKEGRERSDEPEAPDEIRDDVEALQEEQSAEEADQDGEKAQADLDQEIEIPDAEGGEAQKVKLSELIEAHKEYAAFKNERTEILSRVEMEAKTQAQGILRQSAEQAHSASLQIQAVLQQIQPPQPAHHPAMLDVNNPAYNPDQYHMLKHQYEMAMGRYSAVQQYADQLKVYEAHARAQVEDAELDKLGKLWPEFTDEAKGLSVRGEFMSAMSKHYGYTPQELDNSLNDHRNALVARDALKWREHLASSKRAKETLQERVAQKAPAKTQASDGKRQQLSSEQAKHMNARKALKASGKTEDAARAFLKFV